MKINLKRKIFLIPVLCFFVIFSSVNIFADYLIDIKLNIYNLTENPFINKKQFNLELVNDFYNSLFKKYLNNNKVYKFNLIILNFNKINKNNVEEKLKDILYNLYKINNNDYLFFTKYILKIKKFFSGISFYKFNDKIVKNLILYNTNYNIKLNYILITEIFNSLNNFYINNYFSYFNGFFNQYIFNESISNFLSVFLFTYFKTYKTLLEVKTFENELKKYENTILKELFDKYNLASLFSKYQDGYEFKNHTLKIDIYKNDVVFATYLFIFEDFWIYFIKNYGLESFKKFIFDISINRANPYKTIYSITMKDPMIIIDNWYNYLKNKFKKYLLNKKYEIIYNLGTSL